MRVGTATGGLKRVRHRRDDAISRLGWDEVERRVADHYRAGGYAVEHCGTAGGQGRRFDGGVDLRLRRGDERLLVQVKHWNAYKVAHNDVHQLLGLVANEGATGGILVSSGEFTSAARESARRLGLVRLIDGEGLRAMLGPWSGDPSAIATPVMAVLRDGPDGADMRAGAWPPRRRAPPAEPDLAPMLAKFAAVALALLLLAHMFQTAIDGVRMRGAAAARPHAVSPPAPALAHAQSGIGRDAAAERDALADEAARTLADADEAGVPDWQAPSDLAQWRRDNAEAMRIIAATTPELPRRP